MFALIFYSSSSLLISVDTLECKELSFSAWSTDLGLVHTLQRIAIIAPLSIFYVYIEISDDQSSRKQLHSAGGSPLVGRIECVLFAVFMANKKNEKKKSLITITTKFLRYRKLQLSGVHLLLLSALCSHFRLQVDRLIALCRI